MIKNQATPTSSNPKIKQPKPCRSVWRKPTFIGGGTKHPANWGVTITPII
ncbi:MAG: hypothetical protein Q4G13_04770 [Moraxella sp.]|nr:hypothetical protein [Moraxella sp.]